LQDFTTTRWRVRDEKEYSIMYDEVLEKTRQP
jgi:hypothetical protein